MTSAVHHNSIRGFDNSCTHKFEQTRKCHTRSWLRGNPFHLCQYMHGAESILIADAFEDTVGFIDLLAEHHVRSTGVARGKCLDTSLGGKDWFRFLQTFLPTQDHRCAAIRLDRCDGRDAVDQPKLLHFLETFVYTQRTHA